MAKYLKHHRFLRFTLASTLILLVPLATVFTFEVFPASASATGNVIASPCLNFHNGPNGADTQIGCIPYGTTIPINCTATGNSVTGPYGATSVWDQTTWNSQTGYVSDAWVYTGTNSAVAGSCSSSPPPTTPTTAPTPTSTGNSYKIVVSGATLYSGPGTNYSSQGSISNGTSIQLVCQTQGTLVGSSYPTAWWDLLNNGQWVSDYFVNTPVLDGRSIAQCSSNQIPAPPKVTVTTLKPGSGGFLTSRTAILNDALSHLNPPNSTYPSPAVSVALGGKGSYGQCFIFVSQVLIDASNGKVQLRYANALGYIGVFQQSAVKAVTESWQSAQPGDVIQINNSSGWGSVHTMIIKSNNGGGDFTVVDQAWTSAMTVLVHDFKLSWVPTSWPGSSAYFWRVGS